MKKRIITLTALLLIAVMGLTACGSSGTSTPTPTPEAAAEATSTGTTYEKINLSMGHVSNTDHRYHKWSTELAQALSDYTGGQMTISVYPAEQLGRGSAMLESVKTGTQDLVFAPDAYLANYDGLFNMVEMPYQFSDWDAIRAFVTSDAAKYLEQRAEDQGFVILGWCVNGFHQMTTTNTEVNKPEDLAGLKFRVGNAQLVTDLVSTLGVNPVPISMSETYSALQTGTVDGQMNPTGHILTHKLYEAQNYLAITNHQYVSEPIVMNKDKFYSLPEDVQQFLKDTCTELVNKDIDTCEEEQDSNIAFCEENGMTVTYLDPAPFAEKLQPLYDKYASENGADWAKLAEMFEKIEK